MHTRHTRASYDFVTNNAWVLLGRLSVAFISRRTRGVGASAQLTSSSAFLLNYELVAEAAQTCV
jgi:hypothetical protein